jgi:hypothetical protein
LQSAGQQSGYAKLARRLTAWTSNSLATAIVLVLALSGGRQLVRWYQEDPLPSDHASGELALHGSSGEPLSLELAGGGHTLRRESIRGSVDDATKRLQRFCRGVLESDVQPTEPVQPSQQRFLATLADRQPVEEDAGRWSIFRLPGLMPMVVGVRRASQAPVSAELLAEVPGRVLAWGVAVPSGQNDWILYQHQAVSDGVVRAPHDLPIPLPVDSHRTLTISGQGGERTIGIAGSGDATAWQQHFDQHFKSQSWQSHGWQRSGPVWHAQYEHPGGRIAEVHFAGDRQHELLGLVIIGPGDDET